MIHCLEAGDEHVVAKNPCDFVIIVGTENACTAMARDPLFIVKKKGSSARWVENSREFIQTYPTMACRRHHTNGNKTGHESSVLRSRTPRTGNVLGYGLMGGSFAPEREATPPIYEEFDFSTFVVRPFHHPLAQAAVDTGRSGFVRD